MGGLWRSDDVAMDGFGGGWRGIVGRLVGG